MPVELRRARFSVIERIFVVLSQLAGA